MKPTEIKQSCDLISLVANAVATDTIPEAIEYLTERFDVDDPVVYQAYNVLITIQNKQN